MERAQWEIKENEGAALDVVQRPGQEGKVEQELKEAGCRKDNSKANRNISREQ